MKNCVTKKEDRVGNVNIKSHSNMEVNLAGQVLMLFVLSFPSPRPGVPALTSPAAAITDHSADWKQNTEWKRLKNYLDIFMILSFVLLILF